MIKFFEFSCLAIFITWNTGTADDSKTCIKQITDFKTLLLTSNVFVDKTLFVKDFLVDPKIKRILITRPHKWCKTINLDMLNTFFELEVDEHGVPLPAEKRQNTKLFTGGEYDLGDGKKTTLKKLKIAQQQEYMYYQGSIPTLKISFADFKALKSITYQEFVQSIARQLEFPLKTKQYLKKYCDESDSLLSNTEKEQFLRYFSGESTYFDLKTNLNILVKTLYHHYNKSVFVFIDDYDKLFNEAYRAFSETESYKDINLLVKVMFSIFADDEPYVGRALLTGKSMVPKTGPRAYGMKALGLDNFYEFTLLEGQFGEYYGFTNTEVDTLLEKLPAPKKQEIATWYNGYNYGGHVLYNAWSLVNYLSKQDGQNQFDHYWVKSGVFKVFEEEMFLTDPVQIGIKALLNGTTLKIRMNKYITTVELSQTQSVTDFYCLLFLHGYLHAAVSPPYASARIPYELGIPNEELKSFFKQRVNEFD